MTTYALGSDDAELTRLEQQSARIADPTRILLRAAGIAPGMRVLDLGTGIGDSAVILAELVGPSGSVVGLDNDPRMVATARARCAGHTNVSFVDGDVTGAVGDGEYDAVVSRLLVLHLADPTSVLRRYLASVRPGGLLVTLDYDTRAAGAEPAVPLVSELFGLVAAALRSAGADPTIGSRLQAIHADVGLDDIGALAITQYLPPDSPVGPGLLSGVVRSLAPRMVALGLATEAELDLGTLPDRISAALQRSGSFFVPPTLAASWGRRP
ncbi:methyltransferase domain-containing protein [Nocardioides sp. SR21]|uniref:methyltransferase domain-containing protein n=1 Tax=Nocardioides sp. SR21 TaxID=2919501 RepID=UPI001FA984C1|nr:methyltransferase domain-containing protein [Nocardioides sp. SR21]